MYFASWLNKLVNKLMKLSYLFNFVTILEETAKKKVKIIISPGRDF